MPGSHAARPTSAAMVAFVVLFQSRRPRMLCFGSRREGAVEDQIVDTWNIHDRINRYLLEAVPDDALGSAVGPKHRTIAQLFAHMHNVRLLWLKAAAPEFMEGLKKIERDIADKAALATALAASGQAIAALLRKARPPAARSRASSRTHSPSSAT